MQEKEPGGESKSQLARTSLSMVESNMMEADVEKENERRLEKTGIQYPDLTGQFNP